MPEYLETEIIEETCKIISRGYQRMRDFEIIEILKRLFLRNI